MDNLKSFFVNLSKSTKITMFSCGVFIILTFVILSFFVMFPITPSEKIISGMGRASLISSDGSNSPYGDSQLNGVMVTTTSSANNKKNESKVTTAAIQVNYSKIHYTDKIFTTSEGYVYTGYAVPTGQVGYNSHDYSSNETHTEVQSYEEPVYNYEPEPEPEESVYVPEYSEESTESYIPPETEPSYYEEPDVTDPPATESYVPDEPTEPPYVEPEIPADTQAPVIEEPQDIPSYPDPEPDEPTVFEDNTTEY